MDGFVVAWTTCGPHETSKRHVICNHPCTGGATRALASVLLCPVTVVKTRMEWAGDRHGYANTVHALGSIARQEGVRGLFRCAGVCACGVCVGGSWGGQHRKAVGRVWPVQARACSGTSSSQGWPSALPSCQTHNPVPNSSNASLQTRPTIFQKHQTGASCPRCLPTRPSARSTTCFTPACRLVWIGRQKEGNRGLGISFPKDFPPDRGLCNLLSTALAAGLSTVLAAGTGAPHPSPLDAPPGSPSALANP